MRISILSCQFTDGADIVRMMVCHIRQRNKDEQGDNSHD